MPIALPESYRELETAEDYLTFFEIPFDTKVVHVARLHILQRFHDYLAKHDPMDDESGRRQQIRALLGRAYEDFVRSDPIAEGVFKVHKMAKSRAELDRKAFVPLSAVLATEPEADEDGGGEASPKQP